MLSAGQQKPPPNPSSGKPQIRTGYVTKIVDKFGFIDDSIFFPLSAVKGSSVKIGDHVEYECTFSENLPFQWNAKWVQLVSHGANSQSGGGGLVSQGSQQPANKHLGGPAPPSQSSSGPVPPHHHPPPQTGTNNPPPSQYSLHHHHPHHPQQQQQGNYSMQGMFQGQPPNASHQPTPGQPPNSNYYHHQQNQQGPVKPVGYGPGGGVGGVGGPMYPSYSNQSASSGPQPPPGVNASQSSTLSQQPPQHQPSGPQQPPSQHHHHHPPPPQQQQPQQSGHVAAQSQPFTDFAKVQQAVAAATQLVQFYVPNSGTNSASGQVPYNSGPGRDGPSQVGGGGSVSSTPSGQGPPPPSQQSSSGAPNYGQLQYTSTPGSAFINTPQQYPPQGPNAGPKQGPPPPQHGPRSSGPMSRPGWNDHCEERFDPRRGPRGVDDRNGPPPGRFGGGPGEMGGGGHRGGHKSRFNDIGNDRFAGGGPQPLPQNSMNGPGSFGPPPPQSDSFGRQAGGRDEFGRDVRDRKDEPRFSRDKDTRDTYRDSMRDRDNSQKHHQDNRDKDHRNERDRSSRSDYKQRSKKRSISPVNSIASSTGGGGGGGGSHSSRNVSSSKKRFDSCNIPKTSILRNRFSYHDLKSRISSSVHIPSDLKEVLYSSNIDLDLFDIPKPITYKISSVDLASNKNLDPSLSKDKSTDKSPAKASVEPSSNKTNESDKKPNTDVDDSLTTKSVSEVEKESETAKDEKAEESSEAALEKKEGSSNDQNALNSSSTEQNDPKDMEIDDEETSEPQSTQNTGTAESNETVPIESKTTELVENSLSTEDRKSVTNHQEQHKATESSASKINHKFNVKVLLISLPQLSEIYERIFGPDFDGGQLGAGGSGSSSKNRVTHLNKLFSLLVTRNSNDGYSLIGGKFVQELDGFLSGTNEPNLIATAIRIVHEQTGLNLSSCRQWKVFSTFVYNRDNHFDLKDSSYEVTKIYLPDIWSAFDTMYQPFTGNILPKSESVTLLDSEDQTNKQATDKIDAESKSQDLKIEVTKMEVGGETETDSQTPKLEEETKSEPVKVEIGEENEFALNKEHLESVLSTINDLKVVELKNELEKLGIKMEGRPKKQQLEQRLREFITARLEDLKNVPVDPENLPIVEDNSTNQKETEDACSIGSKRKLEEDIKDNVETIEINELCEKKAKIEESSEPEGDNTTKSSNDCHQIATSEMSQENGTIATVTGASPSNIKVKGHHLTVVSLSAALNPHRFDQFELSVVAEFLRDSLVSHFARYIFSSLVYNSSLPKSVPNSTVISTEKHRVIPVNYVHLAFSYFDKNHCGQMPSDDLLSLLNITGYSLSKKVFNSLVSATNPTTTTTSSSSDRVQYREFQQPPTLLERVMHYPSVAISQNQSQSSSSPSLESDCNGGGPLIVERNSTQYNVDELIKQSEADQKIKVRLNEQVTTSSTKIVQLEQLVNELETKQKKMSAATARQNDELCAVKRDRDQLKNKFEQLRKTLEKTLSSLGDALKQCTPAQTTSGAFVSGSTASATTTTTSSVVEPSSTSTATVNAS